MIQFYDHFTFLIESHYREFYINYLFNGVFHHHPASMSAKGKPNKAWLETGGSNVSHFFRGKV